MVEEVYAMKIYEFTKESGKTITRFNSSGVTIHPLLKPDSPFQIGYFYLEAKSVLGMHLAMCDQVLMITSGNGWVRVKDGEKRPVKAGMAVYWSEGEEHESGTETGMTAIVAEGSDLDPKRFLSSLQPGD
ncbi:cupin [Rossellomorea marisflavi]|uniref:Cupin n=2 Tax=Rossellomorea marisflavi TaxID=189381 RepID=A0A5D4RLK1_9BACI|nr:cupin [Rossellomorea marisflavi]